MQLDDWVLCRIYKKSKLPLSSTEASTVVGDQDQAEEHFFKDTLLPISKSPTPPPPQNNTLISQKSVSFSNLLDAMDMDYSMLRSILSENHSNPHGNIGSSSSAGFNTGNLDPQQQHSQINTSISNNSYMFHQKNVNPQVNPSSGPNNNMENIIIMRPKRQLSNIDEETLLHPSKKYLMSSSCSFPNNTKPQYENPQWNYLVKQSLLNQQLLLGPHLRFQG